MLCAARAASTPCAAERPSTGPRPGSSGDAVPMTIWWRTIFVQDELAQVDAAVAVTEDPPVLSWTG